MLKNMSFKEAVTHSPGAGQLWQGFMSSVTPLLCDKPKNSEYAAIDAVTLLGHSRIILEWLVDWGKNLLHESEQQKRRLEVAKEIGEAIIEERNHKGKPNVKGIAENHEDVERRIGYLMAKRESVLVNDDEDMALKVDLAARDVFARGWEDVHSKILSKIEELSKEFDLTELGQQKGSDYWRKKDSNYPSFPSRPPIHPTATPLLVGQDVEQTEFCHCIYCGEDVPVKTYDSATGKCKCEDQIHLKCGHMLSTRIKQGGDKRPIFNPDADRDMSHP
jgi:hypothetical protein